MNRLLLAGAFVVASIAAWAEPSVNAAQLSCDKVQAAIKANGSVIVHYRSTSGSGAKLYARHVSDSRFCDSRLTIVFASVPTADKKACRVRKCASVY